MFTQTETPVMPPAVAAALSLIQVLAFRDRTQETEPKDTESRVYAKACETVLVYLADYVETNGPVE